MLHIFFVTYRYISAVDFTLFILINLVAGVKWDTKVNLGGKFTLSIKSSNHLKRPNTPICILVLDFIKIYNYLYVR